MRLTFLNPQWMVCGGEGIFNADMTPAVRREGIGVSFDCPCAKCGAERAADKPDNSYQYRVHVFFKNPIDGGVPFDDKHPMWERSGTTFDDLVTRPSILSDPAKGGCGWHGYIGGAGGNVPGEVTQ